MGGAHLGNVGTPPLVKTSVLQQWLRGSAASASGLSLPDPPGRASLRGTVTEIRAFAVAIA
jgi:hypothetical protein